MNRPSPYSQQIDECMCGLHRGNSTGLNACEGIWLICYAVGRIWLSWFGPTCPFRGKGHCKLIQRCYHPMMRHFYPDWSGLFQDDNTSVHRVQEVTEWFDDYENYVNHIVAFTATQLNTRSLTIMLDNALHHHHQTAKRGNIFWKEGVHPSSRVL